MAYRTSRNITASIVDFLKAQLVADGWSGITVLKGSSRVYNTTPPVITVRLSDSNFLPVEIGDNATRRETLLFLDIYGADSGMGMVEDLKDWLVSVIKNGVDYFEYVISSGQVHSKIKVGRIDFLTIKDSPINFDADRATLDVRDKWRWIVSATIETGISET